MGGPLPWGGCRYRSGAGAVPAGHLQEFLGDRSVAPAARPLLEVLEEVRGRRSDGVENRCVKWCRLGGDDEQPRLAEEPGPFVGWCRWRGTARYSPHSRIEAKSGP